MQGNTINILAFILVFLFAVTVSVSAQGLATDVVREDDTVTVSVAGATPSSAVALAIDGMICTSDVDGDRSTTAVDVTTLEDNYGPCDTFEKKIFDQNNDGFINDDDRDLVQAAIGCSDAQSYAVPGCSISADINIVTAALFWVSTDANGAGSIDIPLGPGTDASMYMQVVDIAACAKTALRSYRFLDDASAVGPISGISCIVKSDFNFDQVAGLVEITTDLDTVVADKSAIAQTNAVVNATAGSAAFITLGETPCSFDDGFTAKAGVALGLMDVVDLDDQTEKSEARIHTTYQPVALDVQIGSETLVQPYSGLWQLVSPDQGSSYTPFTAQVGVLTTANQMTDVLDYYAVPPTTIEAAEGAVFLRVPAPVDLDTGQPHENGFHLWFQNFIDSVDETAGLFVATRLLSNADADGDVPTVTVESLTTTSTILRFNGSLSAGDYLILLSSQPFNVSHDQHPTNPPSLVLPGGDSAQDCPDGGTPPPPKNPPAVPGAPCTAGMGFWLATKDCVLTATHWIWGPTCKVHGPILVASTGGAPGVKIGKKITLSHKGSASVGVTFGGVEVKVGHEIEYTEENSVEYTIGQGNGCGENIAWYAYFKICVTRYQIKYHTWESVGLLIYPCWCCGCCYNYYRSCLAGSTYTVEVCSRACD